MEGYLRSDVEKASTIGVESAHLPSKIIDAIYQYNRNKRLDNRHWLNDINVY